MLLEYRDLDLIEIFANKLGIFVKHNLIPFEYTHLTLRVCVLLNLSNPLLDSLFISSKWGSWNQKVVIQDASTVDKFVDLLGHHNTQCQGPNQHVINICSDHISDLLLCTASHPLSSIHKTGLFQEQEVPLPEEVDFSVSHNIEMQEMLFQVFSSIRTWLTLQYLLQTSTTPDLLTYSLVEPPPLVYPPTLLLISLIKLILGKN